MNDYLIIHLESREILTTQQIREAIAKNPYGKLYFLNNPSQIQLPRVSETVPKSTVAPRGYNYTEIFLHPDFRVLPLFEFEVLKQLKQIIYFIPSTSELLEFLNTEVSQAAYNIWYQKRADLHRAEIVQAMKEIFDRYRSDQSDNNEPRNP